jgi:hypothetical protein
LDGGDQPTQIMREIVPCAAHRASQSAPQT